RHPHAMTSPEWALAILGLGILLEGLSLRTAGREASRLKGRANWWTFIRRTKNPEISVVLLEDLGALVGLAIAMVSVSLAAWTGDTRFDAVGSIVIGALLGAIAILLAAEMKSLLIGESALPRHEALLHETAMSHPTVRRLIHMRTQHIGPDELLVATKVDFDPDLSFAALSHEIDALENRFREALPFKLTIYVEPDVYEPTLHTDEPTPPPESNPK
ncbi:cation transporter, partial [Myxococcota bacterium]|nr:cation transporter [Myxococcota bacterium]